MSSKTQIEITSLVLETLTKLSQKHLAMPNKEVKAEVGGLQAFLPPQYRERFNEDFKDCAQFRTYGQFAATNEAMAVNFLPLYANFVAAQLAAPMDNYIPECIPLQMNITINPEGLGTIEFIWAFSMVLRSTNPNNKIG